MTALYNEYEPFAAEWLQNLANAGRVAPGNVDARSIREIQPADLAGHTQAHFFAGIGVWSYALRAAGWPDDLPVWTGSCPCQPFSAAGRGAGFADDRHLWPEWFRLIRECRPPVVFGEQVASPDGLEWLDLVSSDLEGAGYAFGAADLCAAGVGAPHIRQRLYFVAYAKRGTAERHGLELGGTEGGAQGPEEERERVRAHARDGGIAGQLADAAEQGRLPRRAGEASDGRDAARVEPGRLRGAGQLGDPDGVRCAGLGGRREERASEPGETYWSDAEWVYCRDGKWRPVEPGTFPLAHGTPGRVGKLRAYGNALNAQTAITFIRAAMRCSDAA